MPTYNSPGQGPNKSKIRRYFDNTDQKKIKISVPTKINRTIKYTIIHKSVGKPVSSAEILNKL